MYYIYIKFKYKKSVNVHKSAIIPRSTIFRINNGGNIFIGKNVELREHVILNASNGGIIELKDNVFINDFTCINSQKSVVINEGVQLGQAVKIYDHDHDYILEDFKHNFKTAGVEIGTNSWIGSNVCILKGSKIGCNCVIGAGSIVKNLINNNTLLYEKRDKYTKHIKRI